MNKKLSILSLILAMLFVSCKNPLNFKQESKESQKAYISISANLPGSNARTVLPNAVTARTTGLTWELKGKNEGSENEKTLKTWSDTEEQNAYDNMCSDTNILLDVGNWQFTLTVYNDEGKVLEATLGDDNDLFEITKDGPNELIFEMKEATGENLANGQIEFTLNFPSEVIGQVNATLYEIRISEDNEILEEPFDSFEWEWIKGNYFSEVTYNYPREGVEKTLLPGSYKLIIDLQQQNGNLELQTINTYSCIIRVAPGLLSIGSYELERLTQLYSITYGYKNLEFDLEYTLNEFEEGNITTTFDEFTEFVLPTPIVPAGYEDYEFDAWYTDSTYADDKRIESTTYQISAPTSLYAKWKLKETLVLPYAIATKQWKDNNGGLQTEQITEAIQTTDESIKITAGRDIEPNPSDVWTYFISAKPDEKSIGYTFEEGNNTVTLQLKSDSETVVGVAAARADMFFTVGTEWKTYTFETGYLAETMTKDITIGAALSDTPIYLRNIKVEHIENSTKENSLPTLSFYIKNGGIASYLGDATKPENIIEVTKTSSNDGYQVTLNTDIEYVDLTIRDYATSGLNKTSFNISLANTSDTLQTAMIGASVDANGYKNNPKVVAWTTAIPESGNLAVYFPAYANNEDETFVPCAIEGILSGGNVSSTMTIKNIKTEKIDSLEETGKVFAIKTQDTWQTSMTSPFSQTMNIPANTTYYFDVLIVDRFEDSSNINWSDCTRFLYSTSAETTSDGKFYYSAGKENDNDVFKITNNTNESCTCKITLTENFTVQIEEVTPTGGTTGEGATSTDPSEPNSGLAYFTKSDVNGGNISCFYIYDAEGLGLYRDLVNGTLEEDLTFTKNNSNVYTLLKSYTGRIDAYLENDIIITDAWIPIGTSSNSFTSSFDGQGHSITINSVADGDYAGVFGYAGNYEEPNSIVNLAVKGVLSSANAKYVGGIVACSNGIKVENCINMASLGSGTYVGGIIGYVNEYTTNEVSKCINAGEIILASSTNHYRGGIAAHTAGNITISDCINLVELSSNGTGLGSGIVDVENTNYNPNATVNNCINVGFVNFPVNIAIANETNTTTIENCYYDSDKWTRVEFGETKTYTPTDTSSIGKSTSELCKLTTDKLSGNWSCVTDGTRYPLPDLSSVFTDNTIWEEIREVAKTVTEISLWADLVDATSELNDQPTVTFLITDDLTADSTIVSSVPAKILAGKNVTISRATEFTGAFFNATASLEIEGTEDAIITFDGKEIDSSAPLIITTADLSLSYCELKNNKNVDSSSVDYGGAICIKSNENDSNFYSTSFSNTSFYNNVAYSGGGIYCQSKNHSNEIKNCSFENNSVTTTTGTGAGIMIYYGRVNIDGITMSNNNFASAEEGNANNINSDIYIYNKSDNILNLGGEVQIDSIWFYHSSTVPTLTISDDISLIEPQLPVEIIIKPSSSTYTLDKLIRLEEDATLSNVQLSCFSISRVESNQKVLYELNEDGSIQLKN